MNLGSRITTLQLQKFRGICTIFCDPFLYLGDIAEEITEHLTEQKAAVEDALAALDRELTQDSGVNGSEAEHEGELIILLDCSCSGMNSQFKEKVSDLE